MKKAKDTKMARLARPILPALDGSTFMKARPVLMGELEAGQIAVIGLPWEGTKVSRLGCRFGPKAIREASYVSAYLDQAIEGGVVDMETGEIYTPSGLHEMVDLGDLGLFHADVHETMRVIREALAAIIKAGAFPLVLGGDHFISYPSIQGVLAGLKESGRRETLGYIHVDTHMDLLDELPFFGKFSSGSQVRRLIDSGSLDPAHMLMIGIGGMLPKVEVDFATTSGIGLLRRHELQSSPNIGALVRKTVAKRMKSCTAIYLTIDIDVNDRSFAPGTGAAGAVGGLLPAQFIEVLGALKSLPLVAVDIVEVAPNLDPSGRTAALAVTALGTVLEEKLFHRSGAR